MVSRPTWRKAENTKNKHGSISTLNKALRWTGLAGRQPLNGCGVPVLGQASQRTTDDLKRHVTNLIRDVGVKRDILRMLSGGEG